MLSKSDLDAIRAIVREEIQLALRQPSAQRDREEHEVPSGLDPGEDDDLRAFARASVARMRGEPGAEERELLAEARYRAFHDASWQERARRRRPIGARSEGAVTVEEMVETLRHWRARRRRRE